jgi:uncharacterized membrane protein YgcG
MEPTLSLGAELLLVATDPNRGGLLKRHRRRFRRALAAAGNLSPRVPLAAWRVRRQAYGELEGAGLLAPDSTPRRPSLAEREARTAVLRRVRRCLRDQEEAGPRDRELLLLMGYAGLLAGWLSRDERRLAVRRLRLWQTSSGADFSTLPGLYSVTAAAATMDSGAWDFGGGEGGGGFDGGGGDGGGGGQ